MNRYRSAAGGFTLVELLVVLLIFSVVGAMVAASMVRGLRADAQARDRIEAFEDMQIAMERVSREVRAADPILAADTVSDALTVRVRRDAACHDFTYEAGGGTLDVTQVRYTADCSTALGTSQLRLLRDLEPTTAVFEFRDQGGAALTGASITPGSIATVRISFEHVLELGQEPVTVSTVVGVRNN